MKVASDCSGNVIAIPQYNNGTLVLHLDGNQKPLRLPQFDVRQVVVSADGQLIAARTHWHDEKRPAVVIWDAFTGKRVKEFRRDRR